MRRRRAIRKVAALVMGAAIRPRGSMIKLKHKGRPNGRPLLRYRSQPDLDHRAPLRGYQPVAASVLHHVAEPRKWIMEALNTHFFRDEHVVGLAPRGLGLSRILIEERTPAGIDHK